MGVLRANKFGSQQAAVTLPRKKALELLGQKSVRVGWITCKVHEIVRLRRCFRCSGHGHTSLECKSAKGGRGCFNCGREGHLAKDCAAEPFCVACQQSGHRSDQMRCPVFRRLVNSERDKRQAKRSTTEKDNQGPKGKNSSLASGRGGGTLA